jgi:hypothetical protein
MALGDAPKIPISDDRRDLATEPHLESLPKTRIVSGFAAQALII